MALKDENLRERVVKVEAEVRLLSDIAKRLPEEFSRIREGFALEISRMREEVSRQIFGIREEVAQQISDLRKEFAGRFERLDQKMDKLMWWVLGVMFAFLIAVIFKH